VADLQRFGFDAEQARQWLASQLPEGEGEDQAAGPMAQQEGQPGPPEGPEEGAPLWVWPENHAAFDLFMRLQTQWALRPDGTLAGLRYEAAAALMQLLGTKHRKRTFRHLQEMEHAALAHLNTTEELEAANG
jgi:hypothetical protein